MDCLFAVQKAKVIMPNGRHWPGEGKREGIEDVADDDDDDFIGHRAGRQSGRQAHTHPVTPVDAYKWLVLILIYQ